MDRQEQTDRRGQVELSPLEKKQGKLLDCVDGGDMAAVLSGSEVMYVFRLNGQYHCFIHAFDAPDGRHRAFEPDERNRAMLKNLDSAADRLFRIHAGKGMNPMGVMEAAERGIIRFLDVMGELPAEDVDFMEAYDKKEEDDPQ